EAAFFNPLIPAKAGTQVFSVLSIAALRACQHKKAWIPAFAGTSGAGDRISRQARSRRTAAALGRGASQPLRPQTFDQTLGYLVAVEHRHLVAGDRDIGPRHLVARQPLPQLRLKIVEVELDAVARDDRRHHQLTPLAVRKSDDIGRVHALQLL